VLIDNSAAGMVTFGASLFYRCLVEIAMQPATIPQHVPPELVIDFDYKAATTGAPNPYVALLELERSGAPPFFYTPAHGGHWVARTYDLVSEIFRDYKRFGTYPSFIPPNANQPALIPIQIDPPEHTRYRRLLGPLFSPTAASRLEAEVRRTAVELIQPLLAKKSCEFVGEYAQLFPQYVFLRLMGMPTDHVGEFVAWVKEFLTGTPTAKAAAGKQISQYIAQFIDAKRGTPGEDWTSFLLNAGAEAGEAALTREETINIAYLLFLAGLDTATNAHAHAWRYFAQHPEIQWDLRKHPERIALAMEELLRVNAITNNSRKVRDDMEFHGIQLHRGDAILLLVSLANRDPAHFEGPDDVRLDREDNRHITFGAGIHRCLGSNLARMELRVSLEEWQRQLPVFSLQPDAQIRSVGGVTMGLDRLPLEWG
jgi:cytochrome P450